MKQASKAGIGSDTITLHGGVLVASLVAVNAFGDIRDWTTGKIVAGARKSPESSEFANTEEQMTLRPPGALARANTTLAVLATNAKLSKTDVTKLAQFATLGVARSIYPVHT